MFSKRLVWFLIFACIVGWFAHDGVSVSPCTLWNQTGCSSIYAGGNPTLGTELAWSQSSFTAIRATSSALPQPKILLTAQNMPCAGAYVSTSVVAFGNQIINYAALLKSSAGVVVDDCNLWAAALASANEYSPSSITIASDCAGGGTIALNAGAPSGTPQNTACQTLVKYDAYFVWAAANSVKIRLGFVPSGNLATNSTAHHGCGLGAPGTVTTAQYIACLGPLITAAMNRWGASIDSVQVLEEPLGETATVQTFTVPQIATIIGNFSALVKAAVPTMPVGAAYTGYSYPVAGTPCGGGSHIDDCYWADAASGTAAASLDFLVIDVFTGNCDQSANYYATELASFTTNYVGTANGKPVRVGQSDAPKWCTIGGPPNEPFTILGCGYYIWRDSGMQTSWLTAFVGWASSSGIQSVSPFFSLFFFNYTTDQANCNCATGSYTALAMSNLSPQDAAGTYRILGLWPATSWQGVTTLGGRVQSQ